MVAGNTCAADLVDTVHNEMDRAVCSHCFNKNVWSRVIEKQVVLEKEATG